MPLSAAHESFTFLGFVYGEQLRSTRGKDDFVLEWGTLPATKV